MTPKNYIIGERLRYLGLGAVVGFIIALNKSPVREALIIALVLATIIFTYWFKRK